MRGYRCWSGWPVPRCEPEVGETSLSCSLPEYWLPTARRRGNTDTNGASSTEKQVFPVRYGPQAYGA